MNHSKRNYQTFLNQLLISLNDLDTQERSRRIKLGIARSKINKSKGGE